MKHLIDLFTCIALTVIVTVGPFVVVYSILFLIGVIK
jgi:hypothetical protein